MYSIYATTRTPKEEWGLPNDLQKLKTTGVIYDVFIRILSYLRSGGETPTYKTHIKSHLDKLIHDTWEEHRLIGWDQTLKEGLSSNWGNAHGLFIGLIQIQGRRSTSLPKCG